MKNTSTRNKLFALIALWVILTAAMFMYFFKILDNSNQLVISSIADQEKTLTQLSSERDTYVQGQKDLDEMAKNVEQPENFFTTDVTLVRELQTLEQWANRLNVRLELSGLSGTVKGATLVGNDGNVVTVPYSMTITGPFTKVVDYLQVLENLDFITTVTSLNMASGAGDEVTANIGALFYIRVNRN